MRKYLFSTTIAVVALGAMATASDAVATEAKAATAWPPSGGIIASPAQKATALAVVKVNKLLASPMDSAWATVPAFRVDVQPQQMTAPGLEQGTISGLDVQGVTDGKSIAWRVTWDDPAADGNVDTGRFSDAVAVEFPVNKDAAATMGNPDGGRVQILYWKALWQKDKDVGFQDVQSLHPNVYSDLYWFATGTNPFPTDTAFKDPRSHQWMIAQSAGNPMAVVGRPQPVEELIAEGWGTLTHQPKSTTTGSGAWAGGRWSVVFVRPLKTDDQLDYQFGAGQASQIGFAVWQGGTGNAGGRKHWADWVSFTMPK